MRTCVNRLELYKPKIFYVTLPGGENETRENFPIYGSQMSLDKCFLKHEKEKKRSFEQCVREVEHASFVPLVMSVTGGMAREAREITNFYKRLALLLTEKWDQTYSETVHWLRCLISFSLLSSAIQCIRGARPSCGHPFNLSPVDLVTAEAI